MNQFRVHALKRCAIYAFIEIGAILSRGPSTHTMHTYNAHTQHCAECKHSISHRSHQSVKLMNAHSFRLLRHVPHAQAHANTWGPRAWCARFIFSTRSPRQTLNFAMRLMYDAWKNLRYVREICSCYVFAPCENDFKWSIKCVYGCLAAWHMWLSSAKICSPNVISRRRDKRNCHRRTGKYHIYEFVASTSI